MAIRHIIRALAGVLLLASAGVAHKAEAQNWDGSGMIRFGVFLQGSFVDYDIAQTPAAAAPFRQSASPDGFGVGISSGYDLRLGSFLVGAEADVSFDGGRSKVNATSEQYGIDYFATLRGRFGYLFHPNLLAYGTVGYALLGAEYKRNDVAGGGGGNKKYASLGGLVYGGGLEWDMGWGTSFVEYLHADVGDWDFQAAVSNNRLAVDGTSDVFRLGLKFKVGHDHSHDVYRRSDPLK